MTGQEEGRRKKKKEGGGGEEKRDHVVVPTFFSGFSKGNPRSCSFSREFLYLGNVGTRSVFWQFVLFV